jgi:hypothetical protein
MEIRAVLDGTEINGSQTVQTLVANNVPVEISNGIIFSAISGNIFKNQLMGSTTDGQIAPFAGTGTAVAPSIRLSISKI